MKELKFRQAIYVQPIPGRQKEFVGFHYWGFIDGKFVGPEMENSTIKETLKNSSQYTGFKDINGKEIYQGDIVSFDCFGADRSTGEVKWNEDGFAIFTHVEFQGDLWDIVANYNIEVIGNIDENPELLSTTNDS